MGRSFESQSAQGSTDTFYDTHLKYLLTGMAIYLRGTLLLGTWWNDFKTDLISYSKPFAKSMTDV